MNQIYGKKPVFIFDPADKSNRPVAGYHDNAIIYWDIYPQFLRDRFTQSFTVGLKQPGNRVTEGQWLDAFANLMSGIIICPSCGSEVFYDRLKEEYNVGHSCWNCRRQVRVPPSIVIGKSTVLITGQTKLYAHNIYGDHNLSTVVGVVVQNPMNPKLWGIRNESGENWTYIKADGARALVANGRTAAIARDAKIDFGPVIGEFH
jgi:hypothetical protein